MIRSRPEIYRFRQDLAKDGRPDRHEKHVILFEMGKDCFQGIGILRVAMDFNS